METLESRCMLDASLSGRVFDDLNGNQKFEPNAPNFEPSLECWTVFLDLNKNGTLDQDEPIKLTAADGSYTFDNLEPGEYHVELITDPGFDRTTPIRFAQSTESVGGSASDQVFDPIRNVLYVAVGDQVIRRNPKTGDDLDAIQLGTSLSALDITPDGRYLLVGEGTKDLVEGVTFLYKIDLEDDNSVETIEVPVALAEGGIFDIAAISGSKAFITTGSLVPGVPTLVPLREVDLAANEVTDRTETFSGGEGLIQSDSRLDRNASGSHLLLLEAHDSDGPIHLYDSESDTFPHSAELEVLLNDAEASINPTGELIAIETADLGLKILDDELNEIQTLTHFAGGVAFDPIREILYAGDADNDELVALKTSDWSELYRQDAEDDLLESGNASEWQISLRAKYLSYITSSGVRYIQLDRPAPHIVTLAEDSIIGLNFGNWWNGENRRPKALDNSFSTNEDTPLQVSGLGVLNNDTDPDGDTLTVTQVASTQHGQLLLNSDGTFTYTPNSDYFGSDSFTYRAHDAALESCRVATVAINVEAVNDAPTDIEIGGTSVEENDAGAEIGIVTITDTEQNNQLSYSFSDLRFEIINGILKLRDGISLDHEVAQTIPLTITVFDDGVPSESYSKTFDITVTDVNEHDPHVDTTEIDADEGDGGTTVGTVEVHDDDITQTVNISITDGNDLGIFVIDSTTGIISIAPGKQIDFEGQRTFVLTITVTDNIEPVRTTSSDITIHVQDVNESSPSVSPQTFTVPENLSGGSSVGTVTATDQDTSQTLVYAITDGNGDGVFEIDSETGEITLAAAAQLDYETQDLYELTVTVSDNGDPVRSTEALVTVHVTDANEFAPALEAQTLQIIENSLFGAVVGAVQASDDDIRQTLTFEIIGGNTGNTFEIDSNTGVISVLDGTLLDFETSAEFQLEIRVTDSGDPSESTTGTVTIELLDANEFSPMLDGGTFDVEENSTFIAQVTATDADTAQTISYSISEPLSELFTIDDEGNIRVAPGKTLDFEVQQSYTLNINATDSGSPSFTTVATLFINVLDVNEFDPVIGDQPLSVPENSPTGQSVGFVVATDDDTNQTLTYEIIDGNEDGVFNIVSTTGEIFVANGELLDSESTSLFELIIRVTDNGDPSRSTTGTVEINITDQNEFPPSIDDQTLSIAENSPSASVVGTIAVNDQDALASFTAKIIGGDGANVFSITDTGQILVIDESALDFETKTSFTLIVEISDTIENGATDSAQITIEILDVNEFAPVLADARFNVMENAENGTSIGTVSATDDDTAQSITYAITAGNNSQAFSIDPGTGEIQVANSGAINFEAIQQFVLTVTATDSGNPARSDTAQVIIDVQDANETAPLINNQSFEIDENVPVGTLVGTVLARDSDVGQSITFSLGGGNTDGAFAIDQSSGELRVANAAVIDYETRARYRLTVIVTDNGSPTQSSSATVTVDVRNLNDPPIQITLDNNQVRRDVEGAFVGHVGVQDQDLNDHHTFTVDDIRFEINTARELKLKNGQSIDSPNGTEINIVITATDLGGNDRSQPFVLIVTGTSNPWQNPADRHDVNDDGTIAPLDALTIINEINNPQYSDSTGKLVTPRPDIPGLPYYDVNGDGFVTAIDVLIIINKLNNAAAEADTEGEGEGESTGFIFDILHESVAPPLLAEPLLGGSLLSAASDRSADQPVFNSFVLAGNLFSETAPGVAIHTLQLPSLLASTSHDDLLARPTHLSVEAAQAATEPVASESFGELESALAEIAEDIADHWWS